MRNRLGLFLAISLLLNLGVLVVITDPTFQKLIPLFRPPAPPPPPPPSLTLLKMEAPPKPPKTQFIPTLPSQAVAQADPNAVLESERNTEQRSRDAAKDPNSPLPSINGSPKARFNYQDIPPSPDVKSKPSLPSEAAKPTPPTPPTPPAPAPTPKPASPPPPQAQPVPAPEVRADAVPITAPEVKAAPSKSEEAAKAQPVEKAEAVAPAPQAQPPQPPQPRQRPQQPAPASPPPSVPTFAQQKSDMGGGARNLGDPSPQSRETEIGRYKAKLYKMIGSRWYHNVDASMTLLGVGEVRMRFYVQSNGLIDPRQIEILNSADPTDILPSISRDAVARAYGEPFSDAMKQQLGDGFWEEITFSIY